MSTKVYAGTTLILKGIGILSLTTESQKTGRRATNTSLEEGGENKQHRSVKKKSIIRLDFGALTTVLGFERELHLQ